MFESDFLGLMASEVTIEPFASQDGYGKPVFGSPVTYQCRVVGKVKMIRDDAGRERVSTVQVYLSSIPTVPAVTVKDRITLPEDYSPTQPQIIAVVHETDEDGPHHLVVYT